MVFYAQNSIDTYKAIVDTTTNNNIKLQYLDSILYHINADVNVERYISYSQHYIKLSED